ncbi:MAG: serine/threonine protein kinase [Nannocystis sp.]|nr:serine/threonine protein kinase [Nannocystis sp.]
MVERAQSSGFEATLAIASAEGLAHTQRGGEAPGRAEPGARISRYLILDELGRGGMGIVYAAYDPQLDRKVAIKVISVDALAASDEARSEAQARLLREAQAMARLHHPNVVAVYDVGSAANDIFIAMELVVGGTVREWLSAAPRSVAERLRVFIDVGHGLSAAHAAGLVHRDLKPDNLLIDRSGAVKIADFGLARRIEAADEPALVAAKPPGGGELTQGGALLGTPAYMAPEQHLALTADERSDQYALCVALYEALYGRRPVQGETLQQLRARAVQGRIDPPPQGSGVPRWIWPLLARGLATDPAARWPSIRELTRRLGRDPQRNRRRALLASGLVVTLAAAAGGGHQLQRARAAAEMTECRAPEDDLRALLTAPRREGLRRAITAASGDDAAGKIDLIEGALDGFIERWIDLHAASCAAVLVDRTVTLELKELRDRCAERQHQEVVAVVELLVDADGAVVERLHDIASQLPRPERCDSVAYLAELGRGDAQSARDPRIERVHRALFRVYAEANAGRFQIALDRALPLLADAEAIGNRYLRADVGAAVGRIYADLGDLTASEAHYLHAITDALAADATVIAAEVANQMVYLDGVLRGRLADAERWIAIADGLITRTQDDDLRLQHLNYRGILHSQGNDPVEGLQVLDEALVLADRLKIGRHDRASLLNNRGVLLMGSGRLAEALASHEEALRHLRSGRTSHPDIALTLNGIATIHLLRGELNAAIDRFHEALALQEQLLGVDHPILALTLFNLGGAELEARRLDDARAHAERARALIEANMPPDHLLFGYLAALQGYLRLHGDHDPVAAKERCARGLGLLESNLGERHSHIAYPLICLAETELELGDAASARRHAERALALQGDALDVALADRAHARAALARALTGLGMAELARPLADEALALFRAAGDAFVDRVEELTRWRAEHLPG